MQKLTVQRCGVTYHHSSSWTSAGMWRIQPVSPLTSPCPGMNIVYEICLVLPFLQGRWKHESSKMVLCCHSWLQFLWWTALEKFKAVLFPEIFLWNWNNIPLRLFFITLYFLALPLLAGRQAVPLPGEILFLEDYSVVLKCKKLPVSQNSACSSGILLESQDVSIFADLLQGLTTAPKVTCLYCQGDLYFFQNIMFQFSLQGNWASDACLPLGGEDMNKMYSCLWKLNSRSC